MKILSSPATAKTLKTLLVAASAFYIILYIVLALIRMRYPFELELMEGGSLDHVRRVLDGQQLYVKPSLEFVPFIYTPLYYYVSAAFAKVIGAGFLPLRLVSFLSSLGSLYLIYLIVYRETKERFAGVVAAGLFAATYRVGGSWLDVARVDSLFLLLMLLSVYLVRFKKTAAWWGIGGAVLALSFLTKQVALGIGVFLALYCLIENRRGAAAFIGGMILLGGMVSVILNLRSGGWYYYYVFWLPSHHPPMEFQRLAEFVRDFITSSLFAATCFSVALLVGDWFGGNRRRSLFYALVAASALAVSLFSYLHPGGYANDVLPFLAVIAVMFGIALQAGLGLFPRAKIYERLALQCCILVICVSQLGVLVYNPIQQIPSKADERAGWRLVELIRGIDGEVSVPGHGYLAVMAGKRSYAHTVATNYLDWADHSPMATEFRIERVEAIRHKKFAAVIVDTVGGMGPIKRYYVDPVNLFPEDNSFLPVTGYKFRPKWMYAVKPDDSAGRPKPAVRVHTHIPAR